MTGYRKFAGWNCLFLSYSILQELPNPYCLFLSKLALDIKFPGLSLCLKLHIGFCKLEQSGLIMRVAAFLWKRNICLLQWFSVKNRRCTSAWVNQFETNILKSLIVSFCNPYDIEFTVRYGPDSFTDLYRTFASNNKRNSDLFLTRRLLSLLLFVQHAYSHQNNYNQKHRNSPGTCHRSWKIEHWGFFHKKKYTINKLYI